MEEIIFALVEIICEMIGWGAKASTVLITFIIFVCIIAGLYWYQYH